MTTSVEFTLGAESVTVPLDIQTGDETILTGDIGGLVAAGTTARLRGNCRLIADLHVRGMLLCDPTGVDLDGQNLFDIHTHDGTLNLQGVEKTAWANWGDVVVGWEIGDRLAVAPTAPGVYVPTEITWQGSWTATPRPANSPDVTLVDGSVARPEVANLSQTVTLRKLKRIMIHEASVPNPQTLKWIRIVDSGESGILESYPIHFHRIYDHARGSVIHGVVVEGGKNHAFVPHASHGITQTDCVAYNTLGVPFWWDRPIPGLTPRDTTSDTEDLIWQHCLALGVTPFPGDEGNTRLAGFWLGSGQGLSCVDSVASCVPGATSGSRERSGFHWPEAASLEGWVFQDCVAHNIAHSGIFTWQNTPEPHIVEDFTSYSVGTYGLNHGAYSNNYQYRRLSLTGPKAVLMHAKSPEGGELAFEDILSDGILEIPKHNSASTAPTFFRRCTFSGVVYNEPVSGANGSYIVFEDCGLVPADFDLTVSNPTSAVEIFENGVLVHRWSSGVWS